jgi:hypothetical protein
MHPGARNDTANTCRLGGDDLFPGNRGPALLERAEDVRSTASRFAAPAGRDARQRAGRLDPGASGSTIHGCGSDRGRVGLRDLALLPACRPAEWLNCPSLIDVDDCVELVGQASPELVADYIELFHTGSGFVPCWATARRTKPAVITRTAE